MAEKREKTPEEIEELKKKREKNLKKFSEMDKEKHKAISSKGGKNSVEVKRNKKMLMQAAARILEMPVTANNGQARAAMKALGIRDNEMNYANAILAMMVVKAAAGDVNAAKYIRDTAGLDPQMVLKEEEFEYMKENGNSINVNMSGELETKSRVQIYLPEIEKDEDDD